MRVALLAAASAAAVLATVLVVPTLVAREPLVPASASVDGWRPRGNLAGDSQLASAALRAWEAAPVLDGELPHSDVRVLLAARTTFGRYVMLTGRNALGHRRLAVLSDDPRDHPAYAKRLRLRSDVAFPEDDELLVYRTSRQVGSARSTLLLVVGSPDTTALRYRSLDDEWVDLASSDGAAADLVDGGLADVELRAYRGSDRVAETRSELAVAERIYEPDADLVREPSSAAETCDEQGCSVGVGAIAGPGSLEGARPAEESWDDMADQAEQLWFNQVAPAHRVSSTATGVVLSALLPDGTGVLVGSYAVNGGAPHLVLYVDRPEWLIGRLYAGRPHAADGDPEVLSAVVPGRSGRHLVVLAPTGVSIRYGVGGQWRPLPVRHGIGAVALTPEIRIGDLRVEITAQGTTRVVDPDSTGPLPRRS